MPEKAKKIIIGVDLDGVLIAKPPLIPKKLLEYLYRGHVGRKMEFRFPSARFEKWIRWLSHYPAFRPPISKNIKIMRLFSERKDIKLVAISSRYSFLNGRTKEWFEFNDINGVFVKVCLNLRDLQPHKFKLKEIRKQKVNVFIDDDPLILEYLKKHLPKVKILDIEKEEEEIEKLL